MHYAINDTVAYAKTPDIPLGRVTGIEIAPWKQPNGQDVALAVVMYGGKGPEEAIVTTKLVKWKET